MIGGTAVKFLLVDDHALVREGLKLLFAKLNPEIEVVEADTFGSALEAAAQETALDLILLDLGLPGMRGIGDVEEIRERAPDVPVVILSGAFARRDVMDALDHGAAGFIPKSLGGDAMFHAINLVLSGEKFVPSLVYFQGEDVEEEAAADIDGGLFETLTGREREVLGLLALGNSNNEIAAHLDLQEVTVRARLTSIFRKIGVKSRTQAVGLAIRKGFTA